MRDRAPMARSGMRSSRTMLMIGALAATGALLAACAPTRDRFASGFRHPPADARPRVWWHWMNGNVTKDGIAKDIDWMSRIGIGGLQNFDAALATPQVVAERLTYMSPAWKDAFRFAVERADAQGLEFAIATSPGWSETGGPWVAPRDGMKKLVWSETRIAGGAPFTGRLAPLPHETGSFQDSAPAGNPIASAEVFKVPEAHGALSVLAYRSNASGQLLPRVVDGDGKSVDAAGLFDGSYRTAVQIRRGTPGAAGALLYDYGAPVTIASASVGMDSSGRAYREADVAPVLEASDDARRWRKIADFPLQNGPPASAAFAPVTARYFRFVFHTPQRPDPRLRYSFAPGAVLQGLLDPPTPLLGIREAALSADPRIDRFESKGGYSVATDYYALDNDLADAGAIDPQDVVDLTARVSADGRLDWTPPPGSWRILRFGWSLIGTTNHPATAEATGLEVDKYDAAAVRRYLETYLKTFSDTTGPRLFGARGLRAMVTDSIEVGASNWTGDMLAQFRTRRGYDATPWLPTLAGVVVGSRARSDAFLYDYRQTLAELLAENHYGTIAGVAKEQGLTLYGEALEVNRPVLGNDIAMRRYADIPTAALWSYRDDPGIRTTLLGDLKGASSVAHLYGRNLVAAESFTAANSPWAFAPSDLKRFADQEFALGINRPIIHTSVHQPDDSKQPGLSLSFYGQYFNRHETWAELSRPWVDYLSRSSFLLQQGRNIADVAYFFGEEAPLTAQYIDRPLADTPTRYAYDFVDAGALADQLHVEGGELVSKSGARYRALYLGGTSRRMTLPVLRRIADFVRQGLLVVGDRPSGSPSLADDAAAFDALASTLWAGGAVTEVGRGRVMTGSVETALAQAGLRSDFESDARADAPLAFVHRRFPDGGDIYFVSNPNNRAISTEARFRVVGRAAERWSAEIGTRTPLSYRSAGGTTTVPLSLEPRGSTFVVFRERTTRTAVSLGPVEEQTVVDLTAPWEVAFQPGRGAPPAMRLRAGDAWNEQADPGIRYFSGVATYRQTFALGGRDLRRPLWLDLGRVGDIAEVRLNGKSVGTAWTAPYRVPLASAARAGANRLEIRVANLWVNRLIGDQQPGAERIAYTTLPTYRADAPLRPSGLLAPVRVIAIDASQPRPAR